MELGQTLLPWASECVSDHCRVFVGSGRRKIILARLAPKQLPENETAANGRLMAAAPELLVIAETAIKLLQDRGMPEQNSAHPIWKAWDAVKKTLEGPK